MNNCIICFLEDDWQENLRNVSHSACDRFEDVLEEYKKNFINEFYNLNNVENCEKHNSLNEKTREWVTCLQEVLQKIQDLESVFDTIRKSYVEWLKGKPKDATQLLEELVTNKNLLISSSIESSIFFRGRWSKSVLQKEDLYHIPFDLRYLVANQRYSLAGQPILYLGLSVLDVVAELRAQIGDIDAIYFSSFLDKSGEFKIFDFTSQFQSEIKNVDIIINSGSNINYEDEYLSNSRKHVREFYKYILLNVCSFKRRIESSSFIEEYIIPQLITSITRNKEFDGILFTSTRINSTLAFSTEKFHVNRYKENLALFTKYNSGRRFDDNLLAKFSITNPIKKGTFQEVSFSEIKRMSQMILELHNKKQVYSSIKQLAELSGITYEILFKTLKICENEGVTTDYFDHEIGKLHNYIIYLHLIQIRNQLSK